MGQRVEAPRDLRAVTGWFVLICNREGGRYELALPNNRDTYSLGNAAATRVYFRRQGLEHLGGRAIDSATAFGAAQASIAKGRAWGLDLTTEKAIDGGRTARLQEQEDYDRLLGGIEGDEPVEAVL